MSKKYSAILKVAVIGIGFLLLAQAIPYGKSYGNPPIINEPTWEGPQSRALAKRACFDCHSHETERPWYSRIAPMSWLAQYDVDQGRRELNFSDWKNGARKAESADKMREEISEGGMPPIA